MTPASTPTADLRVVLATPAELDRYIDALEELADWMHERGIEQWPRDRARNGRPYYEASVERRELYVAYLGGAFVGGLRLLERDPIVWPDVVADDALYLYTLAVRRTFGGQGVGRRLIDFAERRAEAAGRPCLRLDCMAGNLVLRRYYEDAGFAARGDVDAVYPGLAGPMRLRRYEKAVGPWR